MAALVAVVVGVFLTVPPAAAQSVFLSEIHYDNSGADEGEAVEVTGPAGTSLDGWSIALYNGNGGTVYETLTLSGAIPEQQSGLGAVAITEAGIQNGASDGLALVDADSNVIQFLSYEGSLTAVDGPAEGSTSVDVGIAETSATSAGTSLQLVGTGRLYSDFSWTAGATQSFGEINAGLSVGSQICYAEETGVTSTSTVPCIGSSEEEEDVGSNDEEEEPGVDDDDEDQSSSDDDQATTSSSPCEVSAFTPISDIQGSETATPLEGVTVTVKGTVTAVFPLLLGFFVQGAGDGDPATSDGIFVYQNSAPSVVEGDLVAVTGTATDYFDNTQITIADVETDLEVCSTDYQLPDPVEVTLPTNETTLEALEGMLVSITRPVVTENYNAGTFGEISVAEDRLWQFTQVNRPGIPSVVAVGTAITIDDGASGRYPDPDVYVDQASVIRVGQTLNNVEGIVAEAFSSYRLQPTSKLSIAEASNPRPTEVPRGEGNLRVASFNVLNYFTTLNSRGAKTVEQREAQLAKITKGALALNADVIGIVEVENDYDSAIPSIQVIVDSINAGEDEGAVWQYVVPSAVPLGDDEIAVGIIYDSTKVATKGSSGVLDYGDQKTRASLAQTLELKCETSECPAFTLVVNHFKSKGSSCDSIDDYDAGDGQGNCNGTRTAAMKALLAWMSNWMTAVSADPDVLLVGDFNAYAMEDPIQAAAAGGFVDLSSADPDFPRVSSYVFRGESGTLDYILASTSAATQRAGVIVHYHVNADETSALEYDNCDTNPACTVSLDQYRCSDHDMAVQDFLLV